MSTEFSMDEKLQKAKNVLKSLNDKTYVKKVVTKITEFTLPEYIIHYKGSGDREGYTITGHPNQTASVSFTDMQLTMEKKYELTLNVLEQLNNNTYIENIKFETTIDHNENTLPKYIRRFSKKIKSGKYAEGYMVTGHPNLASKFTGITDM
jgi:O-acetylhomoserine/O-acetylserine sulfhydrylase-like pyridoxal-dependent enzyme